MKWRLHRAIFDDRLEEAISILDKSGDSIEVIDQSILADRFCFYSDGPICSLTSIQDAVKNNNIGTPGLYFNKKDYSISKLILNSDSEYLLHPKGVWCPFGLINNIDFDYDYLFIRPDSGNKEFPGITIKNSSNIMEKINKKIIIENISPETMCFISESLCIEPVEYRVWVCDRKIVSHSPYSHEESILSKTPEEVLVFINEFIHKGWCPDISYVVDVAVTKDDLKVIEINALSTSGVYNANLTSLFNAVRDISTREYNGEVFL